MTKRIGKYGNFLGCTNYPKCKNTINLEWDKARTHNNVYSAYALRDAKTPYTERCMPLEQNCNNYPLTSS